MTRYEQHTQDLIDRAAELSDRIERWKDHPGLHTRVPRIREELAKVEAAIPKAAATARWAKELYGA